MEKYYNILDINTNAKEQDVKQAYRDLVKVWHLDRFTHDPKLRKKAEEKLKEINEAYQKIIDYLNNSYKHEQSYQYQKTEKQTTQSTQKQHYNESKTQYASNTQYAKPAKWRHFEKNMGFYIILVLVIFISPILGYIIASKFTKKNEIIDVTQPVRLKPMNDKKPPPSNTPQIGHVLTQEELIQEGIAPSKFPQSGQILNPEDIDFFKTPPIVTKSKSTPNPNLAKYTDEELFKMAGIPVEPLPKNGAAIRYFMEEAIAPLKIVTKESGQHYFVKIIDWYTGKTLLTIFIRSGQSVNVKLPLGSYKIKYATGKVWYGKTYLFGPETTYSEADKKLDFEVSGSQVLGYTIELFLQRHGNLKTKKISAAQF